MPYFHPIGQAVVTPRGSAPEIRAREAHLAASQARILDDRPARTLERLAGRQRMTARARVAALCDENAQVWDLGVFVGQDQCIPDGPVPLAAGVFCALSRVCGRMAMIIANDNTQAAGAWWPGSPEKIVRAQEIALRLGVAVFYLIECAGLYLPTQNETYAGAAGAGAIFKMQARLNRSGILQVAAVFGDCIAGGGYMPLLCDRILMTEQASICIGGVALNRHSKGGRAVLLGTPATHVHVSGCAEERVPDDAAALARLREIAQQLPSSLADFFRLAEPLSSPYSCQDLYDLLPAGPHETYDMHNVLARLVDGGLFKALLPEYGQEIVGGLGLVDGLPTLFLANQSLGHSAEGRARLGGVLYREGIVKLQRLAEDAREDGIPVVWIQDVAGFDIGEEAEAEGLLRHGARLLRTLTSDSMQNPPSLTILLRKASGAGFYAMKGTPFEPALIVATALTELAVMRPDTLAAAMYDKKIEALDTSPAGLSMKHELEERRARLIERQMQAGRVEAACARGDVDAIVPLGSLRCLVASFVAASYQSAGRPRKPKRLWTLLADEV